MDSVIKLLNSKNELKRHAAINLQEADSRDKIKNAIIRGAKDNDHFTRISAINGLGKLVLLGDIAALELLEELAQGDPFKSAQPGSPTSEYRSGMLRIENFY